MPPKKQEEFDITTLPPWVALTAAIRFECSKSRAERLRELLKQSKTFQRNLTRDDIIQTAKDKGLYIEASQQQDKKKDSKALAEAQTELTPALLAKTLNILIEEANLQGRKAKKDQLDGKNLPQQLDPKKVDPKAKPNDAKKPQPGKVEQHVAEVVQPVVQEKEYQKHFDQLYLLFDYPEVGDDVISMYTVHQPLHILLIIREKVTNWGAVDMGLLDQPADFEGDLRDRMEEFIEEQQEAPQEQAVKVQRGLSPRSKDFCQAERQIVGNIQKMRRERERKDSIRNLVVKELTLEVDLDIEEETLKGFSEQIMEEICTFSLDSVQFNEWIHTKKAQALITKQRKNLLKIFIELAPMDQFDIEIQRLKDEAKKVQEERQHEAMLLQQQQEQVKGQKGAIKEVKKTEEEIQREKQLAEERRLQEEARQQQLDLAFEQQQKLKAKMFMQYYKKQLAPVEPSKVGGGVILEVLLDQIEADKQQLQTGLIPTSLEDEEDSNRVSNILNSLEELASSKNFNEQILSQVQTERSQISQDNNQYKCIINEHDEVEIQGGGSVLTNQQKLSERERLALQNLCVPGIDRFMMPEIPEKSELLRKSEKSKLYPFISVDVNEFERRSQLIRFEEILKETEPEQEFNFGNRIYLERHNKNTLTQALIKAMLYDPHIIAKYNEKDDSLQLALYFRNPPGRILRRKWSAEWRILPNLESWLNYFKSNENNLKNDQFYDIDYERIGNFHERSKVLYPTDNSLVFATKYQVGGKTYFRYKVVKEGAILILQEQKDGTPVLSAIFDNLRLSVQNNSINDFQVSFNLTLVNGLIVRFMANGDVHQKYALHGDNKKNTYNNLLNLYDNAEINHEQELKRIITGQGSVIKYMKDGSVMILYANGNVQVQSKNGVWITTNNKGFRKARRIRDGAQWALDSVPCATKLDPESGAVVYIRDDQTMVINYKDGSQYTQHKDGTKMLISASKDSILVEHDAFCSIKISVDRVKARTDTVIGNGSAYANVGYENIFERSNDGRLVETFIGPNTRVLSYREKQELPGYKTYKLMNVNLLYLSDGSVCKIVDDGEITLVTAQERARMSNDIDYWLQLFSVPEERKPGVFTAQLNEGKLWTKDAESNYFCIKSNGEVEAQISVSLNNKDNEQQQLQSQRPQTPDIPDGDYIDEENKFLPPPNSWLPPRLFVIHNNNTGVEYLCEQQLSYYMNVKEKDPLCNIVKEKPPGISNCTSLTYITQIVDQSIVKQQIIQAQIPQTLDIIPKTLKKNNIPAQRTYTIRNLLRFDPFDKEARDQHSKDLEKYEVWKKTTQRAQQEFGIIQKPEDEKDAEFNIQLKIMESRKTDYKTETYDQMFENLEIKKNGFQDILKSIEKEINTFNARAEASQKKLPKEKRESVQDAILNLQRKAQVNQVLKKSIQQEEEFYIDRFVDHYFLTIEGQKISKTFPPEIFNVNPKQKQRILSEVEYSQQAKTQSQVDFRESHNDSQKDDQILEPVSSLENLNKPLQPQPIIIKPSVFTQAEIDEEIKRQQIEADNLKYRQQKRPDYNIYGKERLLAQKKLVPCLLKTNPRSVLNQKYILTDSLTDNRIKISSMATRVYQQAPSINDLRNAGDHQTLNKTLDKKNNVADLTDKRNLMINAELNDKLSKDLSIIPVNAQFGTIKQGGLYQMKIQIKNEDVLAQRIVLKQPQSRFAKVFMKQMGPISLGIIREVFVQLDAQNEIIGKFQDEFKVVSKHQLYSIPIHAHIYDPIMYDTLDQEHRKTHKKNIQKKYVHELRFDQVAKDDREYNDSQNSDLLPKINYDKNYKIDPYNQKGDKKYDNASDEEDQ